MLSIHFWTSIFFISSGTSWRPKDSYIFFFDHLKRTEKNNSSRNKVVQVFLYQRVVQVYINMSLQQWGSCEHPAVHTIRTFISCQCKALPSLHRAQNAMPTPCAHWWGGGDRRCHTVCVEICFLVTNIDRSRSQCSISMMGQLNTTSTPFLGKPILEVFK